MKGKNDPVPGAYVLAGDSTPQKQAFFESLSKRSHAVRRQRSTKPQSSPAPAETDETESLVEREAIENEGALPLRDHPEDPSIPF